MEDRRTNHLPLNFTGREPSKLAAERNQFSTDGASKAIAWKGRYLRSWVVLGLTISCGCNFVIPAAANSTSTKWLNPYYWNTGKNSEKEIESFWGFVISIFVWGGTIGALLIQSISERFGRKRAGFLVFLFQLVVVSMAIGAYSLVRWSLYAPSTALLGTAVSVCFGVLPMLITEWSFTYFGRLASAVGLLFQTILLAGVIIAFPQFFEADNCWLLYAEESIFIFIASLFYRFTKEKLFGSSNRREQNNDAHYPHVLVDEDGTWSAKLHETVKAQNKNNSYNIELLKWNANFYEVRRVYSHCGYNPNGDTVDKFSDLKGAKLEFENIFKKKTGNFWRNRQNFQKQAGKYTLLETINDSCFHQKDYKNEQKLDDRLMSFMMSITDFTAMKKAVMDLNYDSSSVPLGTLTENQIQKGYRSLQLIDDVVGPHKNTSEDLEIIEKANDQYFTDIPHVCGYHETPTQIKSEKQINKEKKLLKLLTNIRLGIESGLGEKDQPREAVCRRLYEKLQCTVRALSLDSPDYWKILLYTYQNYVQCDKFDFRIRRVFAIDKEKGLPKERSNRMLLFHGSQLCNIYGILRNGLKVAPPEASSQGNVLGKGVYFADVSSFSDSYCNEDGDGPSPEGGCRQTAKNQGTQL